MFVLGARRDAVNGYPVQAAKVQRPPLRNETLERDRLLDWLDAKIHHRVVLVIADAGYGKTTLLADFSRRTRLRTLWYRLDEDDRDWISLLNHLVAAGREHDPGFAPTTASMLSDSGVPGPTRDAVIREFIRELPAIADQGAALILDDFHLVDDAPDVMVVTRALVSHAPERFSIVVASRRQPTIPLARLRAIGEVAELRTDDLRFDANETGRLFTESYGRPLEPDVLADLARRTEGWAASLQLVRTAIRDRSASEVRTFIRTLTGADAELYDYLAEEVIGELPDDLQRFLMRTSILQVVDPDLAAIVTDLDAGHIRSLMSDAERLGLLTRRGQATRDALRSHPLVRDFLEERLARDIGREALAQAHRTVALHVEPTDWRAACHHFAMAGEPHSVSRVLSVAIAGIVARGELAVAHDFVRLHPDPSESASIEIIRSRADFLRGNVDAAIRRAESARRMEPASAVALANLATISFGAGDLSTAETAARELSATSAPSPLREIGPSLVALVTTSTVGRIDDAIRALMDLRDLQRQRRHSHFEGITQLNLAVFLKVSGRATAALEAANQSVALLESSSRGMELASAYAVRAWAWADLYEERSARSDIAKALLVENPLAHIEVLLEAADIECWYGDAATAQDYVDDVERLGGHAGPHASLYLATKAQLMLRRGNLAEASRLLGLFKIGEPSQASAQMSRQLALVALMGVVTSSPQHADLIRRAKAQASGQGAGLWMNFVDALEVASDGPLRLGRYLESSERRGSTSISFVAELVVPMLADLTPNGRAIIRQEAVRRPDRWRDALRSEVDRGGQSDVAAAEILEEVGHREDVVRLRDVARRRRDAGRHELGRSLARRLAPRIFVEDQGRVTVAVGSRVVAGADIRRRVLAMLCFLATKNGLAATRDEVLDALWPEMDPGAAQNSLNQTVYFLRRVFEPHYREDVSPGYLRHESDIIWLDNELVTTRSQKCREAIRSIAADPKPDDVDALSELYKGQFALDFAYEDWAAAYREVLHSSYLQIIETAIGRDTASGHFARGVALARRALEISPEAEELELSLLRLYRLMGSHSAAAEQYAHYASVLRESLGIEPPPLESL